MKATLDLFFDIWWIFVYLIGLVLVLWRVYQWIKNKEPTMPQKWELKVYYIVLIAWIGLGIYLKLIRIF